MKSQKSGISVYSLDRLKGSQLNYTIIPETGDYFVHEGLSWVKDTANRLLSSLFANSDLNRVLLGI
jgi:hypothetical protein